LDSGSLNIVSHRKLPVPDSEPSVRRVDQESAARDKNAGAAVKHFFSAAVLLYEGVKGIQSHGPRQRDIKKCEIVATEMDARGVPCRERCRGSWRGDALRWHAVGSAGQRLEQGQGLLLTIGRRSGQGSRARSHLVGANERVCEKGHLAGA
jgi:hypothetical protein